MNDKQKDILKELTELTEELGLYDAEFRQLDPIPEDRVASDIYRWIRSQEPNSSIGYCVRLADYLRLCGHISKDRR